MSEIAKMMHNFPALPLDILEPDCTYSQLLEKMEIIYVHPIPDMCLCKSKNTYG